MSEPSLATPETPPLLALVAERVFRLRKSQGWSRAELAKRSGLSVRFLARIESGEGNISILRLAALAESLGTSADRLVRAREGTERSIVLVGMRGAGKSTIGPRLARQLGLPFIEMDRVITEVSGVPLDQLFELHGERYYRRLERDTLLQILSSGQRSVVAAAGGIVNDQVTWEMLLERAQAVWLRASPEDHWNRVIAQGDRRPMENNPAAMEELRAMLLARESSYGSAHFSVDTSGESPRDIVREIRCQLESG